MKKVITKNPQSPLRFPGSKSKVLGKLRIFLDYPHTEYREPFIGGGSIFYGKPLAQRSWLNDKDIDVANFLRIVRDQPEALCQLVLRNHPTTKLWSKLKSEPRVEDPLVMAFRFLFFNRTNYSGIYYANPIGGINQDKNTKYKIDCRWNAELLCKRIHECSQKLKNVHITCTDFEEVITAPGENVLLVIDPPYYQQGNKLYRIGMSHDDHVRLSNLLKDTRHKFLLTIDNCNITKEFYSWAPFVAPAFWTYTVNSKKKDNIGKELLISNFDITKEKDVFENMDVEFNSKHYYLT